MTVTGEQPAIRDSGEQPALRVLRDPDDTDRFSSLKRVPPARIIRRRDLPQIIRDADLPEGLQVLASDDGKIIYVRASLSDGEVRAVVKRHLARVRKLPGLTYVAIASYSLLRGPGRPRHPGAHGRESKGGGHARP